MTDDGGSSYLWIIISSTDDGGIKIIDSGRVESDNPTLLNPNILPHLKHYIPR